MYQLILMALGIYWLEKLRASQHVDVSCEYQRAIACFSVNTDGRKAHDAGRLLEIALSHPPQGWAAQ